MVFRFPYSKRYQIARNKLYLIEGKVGSIHFLIKAFAKGSCQSVMVEERAGVSFFQAGNKKALAFSGLGAMPEAAAVGQPMRTHLQVVHPLADIGQKVRFSSFVMGFGDGDPGGATCGQQGQDK